MISRINSFLIYKFLFNKEKKLDRSNLLFNYFFVFLLVFVVSPVTSKFDDIFRPNLRLNIDSSIIAKTNVRKYRTYPTVFIEYKGKTFYSTCESIDISNFCTLYPKEVEVRNIVFRPRYLNYSRNDGYIFIYEMSYLDKNGEMRLYKASKSFEDRYKVRTTHIVISIFTIVYLLLVLYLHYLYYMVKCEKLKLNRGYNDE